MKLISKDEKLEFQYEDSTFIYHRINALELDTIRRKHMVRGELNAIPFGVDIVRAGLIDWKGVVDDEDKPIKFKTELIDFLPTDVLTDLSVAITGSSEAIEKNLSRTAGR